MSTIKKELETSRKLLETTLKKELELKAKIAELEAKVAAMPKEPTIEEMLKAYQKNIKAAAPLFKPLIEAVDSRIKEVLDLSENLKVKVFVPSVGHSYVPRSLFDQYEKIQDESSKERFAEEIIEYNEGYHAGWQDWESSTC